MPLLSIVSAYLYVVLMHDRSFFDQVRKKAISLLVPLVVWNLIALSKDMVAGDAVPDIAHGDLPNTLFSITEPPMVEPLYFLRDMFVCSMLALPLSWMLAKAHAPVIVFLAVNAVMNLDGVILLNSGICDPVSAQPASGRHDMLWRS